MASVDHRSAADIERDIEDERSALARTLDEIQDRLSFETLSGDFVERVRDSSGEIGRSVLHSVKDNPIPIALTAIGIGWLIASQRGSSRSDDPYERVASTPSSARFRGTSTTTDLRDPDALVDPAPLYDSGGRPLPRGDESHGEDESRWDRATSEAGARAQGVKDSAAHGFSQATDAVRKRARSAYASADDLRHRITHGTEELSASARKRVLAARTRAYEAQLRAEKYTAQSRQKATDFFEEQPLVVGALALAFGAAVGGLLPSTRREDDTFGSYRDQVFDEAERIYYEERTKLESAARETAREMKDVAQGVASDVKSDLEKGAEKTGDIARSKVSDAGTEVREKVGDGNKPGTDSPGGGETKLRKV